VKYYNISFAGAGRLADVLCRELFMRGHVIDKIVTSTKVRGPGLAESCNAVWSNKMVFPESTQIIFVAVSDRNISRVLKRLKCHPRTIVAHTSGSTGIDVFPSDLVRTGVFYPLQTFSHGRKLNFCNLPVFIESKSPEVSDVLGDIARSLTAKVCFSDSLERRMLHLAAVFAGNFTNHMLTLGNNLSVKAGFSFEEIKPLVTEVFMKALENGPVASQTGPALRNDKNTLRKHLELLSFDPDLQKIYMDISRSIYDYHTRLND